MDPNPSRNPVEQDEEMASPQSRSTSIPTGGPGNAPLLPPGDYGPDYNSRGQPSSHGHLGPTYRADSYNGPVYVLPTRLEHAHRRSQVYDEPPPVGAPTGEGRREEQRLRDTARQSRQSSYSHMEDELQRLRTQVRDQHELIFTMKQQLERTELDRNQALDRVAFMERSRQPA
jgi:hypothetical protein